MAALFLVAAAFPVQAESSEGSEFVEADDGNVDAPPGEDLEPLEPDPRPSCADAAGWRVNITGYDLSKFARVEGFSSANRDFGGPPKIFDYQVERSRSMEYSYSTTIGATAGNALFGEIKAEVNAGVKKSMSYTSRFGGSMRVPARHIGIADAGFIRTIVNARMHLLTSNCQRTQHKSVSGRAPVRSHWNTSTRRI